jgi:hypothetical protein
VTGRSSVVGGGSPRPGKCRNPCDSRQAMTRPTAPVQACFSDTALPRVTWSSLSGNDCYSSRMTPPPPAPPMHPCRHSEVASSHVGSVVQTVVTHAPARKQFLCKLHYCFLFTPYR